MSVIFTRHQALCSGRIKHYSVCDEEREMSMIPVSAANKQIMIPAVRGRPNRMPGCRIVARAAERCKA